MENTEQTEIQDQKDINTIVDTVISAIDKRTEKITRSIANDNFSKLSDDDKKAAYELLSEKRQKEANKDKKQDRMWQKEDERKQQKNTAASDEYEGNPINPNENTGGKG